MSEANTEEKLSNYYSDLFQPVWTLGMTIPIYVVVLMLNLLEIDQRLQNIG